MAVDGSEVSLEALERAAALMQKDDKGYLVTVIEPIEVSHSSKFELYLLPSLVLSSFFTAKLLKCFLVY